MKNFNVILSLPENLDYKDLHKFHSLGCNLIEIKGNKNGERY